MGTRLAVGNLSFNTTADTLQSVFAATGTVTEVSMVTDRSTGQMQGSGFVTMATEADATNAIAQLNGTQLNGKAMTVKVPTTVTAGTGFGGGGGTLPKGFGGFGKGGGTV
jgi:RNA recognition motif-containing protein